MSAYSRSKSDDVGGRGKKRSEISLKSMLSEARDTLREVRKRRKFGDSAIAIREHIQKCRKICGLGCVNQACTRVRVTQPSPHIFPHICITIQNKIEIHLMDQNMYLDTCWNMTTSLGISPAACRSALNRSKMPM